MSLHIFVFSVLYLGYGAAEAILRLPTGWYKPRGVTWVAGAFAVAFAASLFTPQADRGLGLSQTYPETECVARVLAEHNLVSGVASWATQNTILFYTDGDVTIANHAPSPGGPVVASD
jgi:hypothetical protein